MFNFESKYQRVVNYINNFKYFSYIICKISFVIILLFSKMLTIYLFTTTCLHSKVLMWVVDASVKCSWRFGDQRDSVKDMNFLNSLIISSIN